MENIVTKLTLMRRVGVEMTGHGTVEVRGKKQEILKISQSLCSFEITGDRIGEEK